MKSITALNLQARARREYTTGCVEVYVRELDEHGHVRAVCTNLVMSELNEGLATGRSRPIELSDAAAQALMDDLWATGLRPTEGRGSAGQAEAMGNHIRDLRWLLEHVLSDSRRPLRLAIRQEAADE